MARNQSAIVNWSQYLALRAVAATVQCFSVEQNLHTAGVIGSAFYRMNKRRRARAEANIARSFPDWSPEQAAECAEASMQHMFRMFLVDALAMPRLLTPDAWPDYVELGSLGSAIDHLAADRPVILVTGHCGNWELLGFVLSMLGFEMSALARPLDNPLINDWLLGIREARGLNIITKFGATGVMHDLMERKGKVGFIADQNAGDGGLFVPFFGRLASSYKSMGLLAMRYQAPIVAGHATRIGDRMKFRLDVVDIIEPEDWEDHPDGLFYLTARVNHAMERMIRAAPEQYLWLHRRWKSRPRHERAGKPVPRRLQEQIKALPWLSSDEAEQIIEDSNRLSSAS